MLNVKTVNNIVDAFPIGILAQTEVLTPEENDLLIAKVYNLRSVFGAGNTLETTDFKVGFANIKNNSSGGVLTQLSAIDKLRLMSKYGMEFLKNPSY